MTNITQELRDPERHYPGNFDTPERAVAFLTGLCQDAATQIESLQSGNEHWRRAERNLSDAYLRLRIKLDAFRTPDAPTAEEVWAHTEAKLDELIAQRDELRAALEFLVDTTLPQTRQQEQCWISIQQALGKTKGQN